MKKLLVGSIVASMLLVGCGDDKLPQECSDMIDSMAEAAKMDPTGQASAQMPSPEEAKAKMEAEWANMNDEKRKEATEQCKKANQMFDMVKSMQ